MARQRAGEGKAATRLKGKLIAALEADPNFQRTFAQKKVESARFSVSEGYWRRKSDLMCDVHSWELFVTVQGSRLPVRLDSCATMTDCLKQGFVLQFERSLIWAVETKPPADDSVTSRP